ncbi:TIGR02710 family CRISPR-associated CARF protein [Glycomyces albidus]|uniref:TIGR02710 family CRISPR-associated CARF protein n=1 Tax=Glycomyces albidus TaxID=2656774 RepID=UPI001884281C|nr:TIGR02710 family CRISPR-associated CARF protein [Glycomyces albidus]
MDLLVSLSGFSPETTIFAAAFLRPKELLVLVSHSAREGIDFIREHVELPASHVEVRRVDPLAPVDLYERIRNAVDDYKRFNGVPNPTVVIDITGGKKSMSAGAALAATQLDSRMCYIDGDFNPEIRQAEPGTERLVMLDNPTKLFGDRQQESAEVEFGHGAFDAAYRRFETIAQTSPTPARARFGCDLSDLYMAWSDLEFDRLGKAVKTMRTRLNDASSRCDPQTERRLRVQLDFLDGLARRREGEPLALTFYLLGKHYEEHGRRDFAALLYYRMLESLFEMRLSDHGISPSKPDWAKADQDPEAFIERYRNLSELVFNREFRGMPFKVGMVESALLLQVLNDPMLPLFGLDQTKALRHLRSMSDARNASVLAHGKTTVSAEVTEKLGSFALRALRAYWRLVHGDDRVDDRIVELRFVDSI